MLKLFKDHILSLERQLNSFSTFHPEDPIFSHQDHKLVVALAPLVGRRLATRCRSVARRAPKHTHVLRVQERVSRNNVEMRDVAPTNRITSWDTRSSVPEVKVPGFLLINLLYPKKKIKPY